MLSFHFRNGVPGAPADFFDGRMDGMDGWDGMGGRSTFFLAHILKTTTYFFLIISVPLNICFCTFFGIFAKKNRNVLFFKKFRQNRGLIFFSTF